MKKLLLTLLAGLMLASPVSGEILVLYGTPAAADCNDQTEFVKARFSVMHKILGFDYTAIPMTDSLGILDLDMSDYTMAIILNLPDIDADLSSYAECVAGGLGDFGRYIGQADEVFTIPMFVPLPEYGYLGGYSVLDTMGIVTTLNDETTDNSSWENVSGDSIFSNGHAYTKDCPLIAIVNQKAGVDVELTPLAWVDGSEYVTGDTMACAFWKYEKTNGHEVYVMSWAGESWQTPHWVDVIAAFEDIEPIKIATHFRDYLMSISLASIDNSDTTGLAETLHETLNWMIANDFKTTFSIDEHYYDAWSTIDDVAAKVFAHSDIFKVVPTGKYTDALGRLTTKSSSVRRAAIQSMLDEVSGDAALAGNFDTTTFFGFEGVYGGNVVLDVYSSQTVLGDLENKGIRSILTLASNRLYTWPKNPELGLSSTARLHIDGNPVRIYAMASAGDEFAESGRDSIADASRAAGAAIFLKEAMACRLWHDGTKEKISSTTSAAVAWEVANHAQFLPILSWRYWYMGARTDDDYITQAALQAYAKSNVLWSLKELVTQVDWNNNICAYIQANTQYTTTGIVPFGYTFIEDINYDRKLGRKYPNQHVTEGGFE